MNPHAYNPDRERQWAEQRHACLLRTFIARPEFANAVLVIMARKPERETYARQLRVDLVEWIAANPREGADLLNRWDQIQPNGDDPNYAHAIRLEARRTWARNQPV
jgi:hypothetical protein